MKTTHRAFSCLVDSDPFIVAQSYIWLNCLVSVQRVPPEQIYVHVTSVDDSDYMDWLKSMRVNVINVEPFDRRSLYCNKLAQLATFTRTTSNQIVLMDCDTAWVGRLVFPTARRVAAKVVDYANPPAERLLSIFEGAGLGVPDWADAHLCIPNRDNRTDRNNCNGGLYIFEASFLNELAPLWRSYATWCLDHIELFAEYSMHADQVAFALAMKRLNASVEPLSVEWNFPTHVDTTSIPDVEPQVLHYHRQLTSDMSLLPTGRPLVDSAIVRLNSQANGFLKRQLVNSVFWNLRYSLDPERGSGIGSRGQALAVKQRLLDYAVGGLGDATVLDVGCGDLEATGGLHITHYTGVDIAKEALVIARQRRPDWQFTNVWDGTTADILICLDVLIHQTDSAGFQALLNRLVAAARARLVVSGYNEAGQFDSAIVAFHQSLLAALKATGAFHEISVIGGYRDVDVIVADKRRFGASFHPNDMEADAFNLASTLAPRPDLLRNLADLSRSAFGFYTKHFPRAVEYPWVASQLETSASGSVILDIGAGLNPVPVFLATRGARVHCLDSHATVRTLPPQPHWNEWGFFDYAVLHPNITSHHTDIQLFRPSHLFDVIYSVSVLEHLPRSVWELALRRCREWLRPAGRLLLTFDLVPGTDLLWNFAEGVEVEPTGVHGDLDAIEAHLHQLGFTISEKALMRDVPESRTDLAFLSCSL